MLTIVVICTAVLLSNPPVCARTDRWADPPEAARETALAHAAAATESRAAPYAAWTERVHQAQETLARLRAERHKAEAQQIALLRQLWYRWGFVDDAVFADTLARIRELDRQILSQEDVLSTTIPDEARHAGIPPRVVSP